MTLSNGVALYFVIRKKMIYLPTKIAFIVSKNISQADFH